MIYFHLQKFFLEIFTKINFELFTILYQTTFNYNLKFCTRSIYKPSNNKQGFLKRLNSKTFTQDFFKFALQPSNPLLFHSFDTTITLVKKIRKKENKRLVERFLFKNKKCNEMRKFPLYIGKYFTKKGNNSWSNQRVN